MENVQSQEESDSFDECIQDCFNCYLTCTATLQYCLRQGGDHTEPRHISLMSECSKICQLCSEFMLTDSPYSNQLCELCSQICDDCADSCMDVDKDDEVMQDCAETCRKCAQSCRQMAQ